MEHTYSYNQKKCATCEYWGGSREVNRAGSVVTYDTDDLCGPCYGDSAAQAAITSGRMLIADIL